jgi:selenocysteine lyase/cysteine desulfurase
MPVREIAAFAAARGIWFHIDGAQSVGMIPVNFAAIGCDSFALSGHKWLGGPHETGLLYLRHDRTADVAVPLTGAHAAELPYLPGELKYAPGALRHEYGTRNAGLIVGLAEAVHFQERIGIARIAAHGRELATRLFEEISQIDGIIMHTPRHDELRSAMTTFSHPRADARAFFDYLLKKHQLRCRPITEQKLEAVRVSTHIFNSHAECERVIAGVRASLRDL